MSHDHHHHAGGHDHGVSKEADLRLVLIALVLVSLFMVGELTTALLGHSLALVADAGHMLTDVLALAMSAAAVRLAARPATAQWSYGMKRAEILSAALNGLSLAAISLVVTVEAIQRLVHPTHVRGSLMIAVSIVGVAVNLIVVAVLSRANRTSLNIAGAYGHILTDLYAFGATAVAGVAIVATDLYWLDAVASLVVVAFMARTSWSLLREAGSILMQATPSDLDVQALRTALLDVPSVREVHDLHVWSVTSNDFTVVAHVVVEDEVFTGGTAPVVLDALQAQVAERFLIHHATFQLEPASHVDHEADIHD